LGSGEHIPVYPGVALVDGIMTVKYKTIDSNSFEIKRGYINIEGEEIIPCIYDDIREFESGFAVVRQNWKFGVINKQGDTIVPCIYESIGHYSTSYNFRNIELEKRLIVERNSKYGFVNERGEEIIPCIYDDAWEFSNGLARVKQNNKYGVIDKNGDNVIVCVYDDLHCLDGIVVVKDTDGWKIIKLKQ